uniref:Uncharacterized protein n=1 Tax=Arundo donax TaxID=35708 RepID=A0A0A8Y8N0_ARUDO
MGIHELRRPTKGLKGNTFQGTPCR